MSQERQTREAQFQNDILGQMLSHGWLLGESNKYNKELALYPDDVIALMKERKTALISAAVTGKIDVRK